MITKLFAMCGDQGTLVAAGAVGLVESPIVGDARARRIEPQGTGNHATRLSGESAVR